MTIPNAGSGEIGTDPPLERYYKEGVMNAETFGLLKELQGVFPTMKDNQ